MKKSTIYGGRPQQRVFPCAGFNPASWSSETGLRGEKGSAGPAMGRRFSCLYLTWADAIDGAAAVARNTRRTDVARCTGLVDTGVADTDTRRSDVRRRTRNSALGDADRLAINHRLRRARQQQAGQHDNRDQTRHFVLHQSEICRLRELGSQAPSGGRADATLGRSASPAVMAVYCCGSASMS